LIEKELGITQQIPKVNFSKLKVFLASCGIKSTLKEELNFIYDSFIQA
jgi:hypothetical protein